MHRALARSNILNTSAGNILPLPAALGVGHKRPLIESDESVASSRPFEPELKRAAHELADSDYTSSDDSLQLTHYPTSSATDEAAGGGDGDYTSSDDSLQLTNYSTSSATDEAADGGDNEPTGTVL